MEVKIIGTKARIAMMGDFRPTASTMKPSVAARLYAGATEAVAMTVLEIRPSAPDLSPLPTLSSALTAWSAAAMSCLPAPEPAGNEAASMHENAACPDRIGHLTRSNVRARRSSQHARKPAGGDPPAGLDRKSVV